jgi:hypothetical protein
MLAANKGFHLPGQCKSVVKRGHIMAYSLQEAATLLIIN